MPRTTALSRKVASAVASAPFDPSHGSDLPAYGAQPADVQAGIAAAIATDKAGGLSGNDLRSKYGEGLTGPMRRRVLRAHDLASPATIARSYAAYSDGAARSGSAHAREHGPAAAERQAQAKAAVAKQAASKRTRAAKAASKPAQAARKPTVRKAASKARAPRASKS